MVQVTNYGGEDARWPMQGNDQTSTAAPTQPISTSTTAAENSGPTPYNSVGHPNSSPDGTALPTESPPPKVNDEQYVRKIVNKAVEETILDQPYSHEATSAWTNSIVESLVKSLVQLDRDNKYIGMNLFTPMLQYHSRFHHSVSISSTNLFRALLFFSF